MSQPFHHTGHRETQRKSRQPSPVSLCALCGKALLACGIPKSSQDQSTPQPDPQLRNDALERANDSSDSACSGYLWSRLLFLRLDHIEILVSRSRVKEHDPIFGAEEAAGAQFLISNK